MQQRALKYFCLLAVLLTLPVTSTAQQRLGEGRRSENNSRDRDQKADRDQKERRPNDRGDRERKADDRPVPRTATPTPRQPSWEQKTTPWWERQSPPWWEGGSSSSRSRTGRTDHDRNDDYRYRGRRNNVGSGVIYVLPASPFFDNTTSASTVVTPPAPAIKRPEPEPPPLPAIGFLTLDVEPRALLQIYVDDVFVGTPADLGNELRLTPGTRRIELRAKGHKTLMFAAEIIENRSISFAGTLERDPSAPVEPAVVRPPAVAGSTTMYMIQGCYLGNIAPKATELRPGCDIARMITFRP